MNNSNITHPLPPVRHVNLNVLICLALAAMVMFGAVSCSRQNAKTKPANVDYYTCTMHPSVKSQDPDGNCPICGMHLVPVLKKSAPTNLSIGTNSAMNDGMTGDQPAEFTVPLNRQQQIGVTYAVVAKKNLQQILRTVGTVTYDKQRHWDFVARVDGYIQKLQVSSRGDLVEKDQPLLTLYSPDLLTTQRELLDLLRVRDQAQSAASSTSSETTERLIESARRRLLLWNLTTNQIAELEKTRVAQDTLTLHSPFKGVVQDLLVDQGRHVALGDHMMDIADLSVVWVWAEFYQDELPLLKQDLPVTIFSASLPGKKINGKISVIDPFINETTRTVRVRLEVNNPDLVLRPEMYVDVEMEISSGEKLAVPVNAVLPTGTRNLVFVDEGGGKLQPRFIELGKKYGTNYVVNAGLHEGDRVVTSANFLIDAEAKVQGALKSWQ